MIIRLSEFRKSKDIVMDVYNDRGLEGVQLMCAVSHIPLVSAYSYILEEIEDEKVKEHLDGVIKFYGITKIIE